MSDVEREVAVTAYGEIEYETATCASCGTTVPKEQLKRFVVGTVQDISHRGALGMREYEFDTSDYQEGWACEYCRNDGVVGSPLKSPIQPTVVQLAVYVAIVGFLVGFAMGGFV